MKRNDAPKSVFNPLSRDFRAKYRNDDNTQVEYVIRSMEIETFPTYLADHMIKHLVEEVANDRDVSRLSEDKMRKIKEEIEVNES